jgi:hypothetical protein
MALTLFSLLEKGYFPRELPPSFNTKSYATYLAAPGVTAPKGKFTSKPSYSMQTTHNLARSGGLRRNLSIPNPKHFYLLADHIVTNWANIKAKTDRSPYSMTKPVEIGTDRAITPEHGLSERVNKQAELRSSNRFIIRADVSRFFPSIYTHSIPWALMGKSIAKSAHTTNTLVNTWQDMCDKYSQKINNNQTIGIPIGPDTSRLLAEIIMAEIDVLLAKKFKRLKGLRFIDDYEFACPTRAEAEKILYYLQYLLNEYELALNINKTKIVELPEELESTMISKVRTFFFRDAGKTGQKNDLIAYFNLVFEAIKKALDENLLKYAIARLTAVTIAAENWILYQNILSQCVVSDPSCLPQVCDQLSLYLSRGYKPAISIWEKCLNIVVTEKVPLGLSSECAWAIWVLKVLNIKLSIKSAKAISETDDSVVALMGLGMASVGLAQMKYFSTLNRYAIASELFEKQWLLCYQGNLTGWLGSSSGKHNLNGDPAFDYLQGNNVSFFDFASPPKIPIIVAGTGGSGGGY